MTTGARGGRDCAVADQSVRPVRFVLLYGVLLFGSMLALLYAVFSLFFRPEVGFWSSLAAGLIVAPFAGALWGALMLSFARRRALRRLE